MSTGYLTLFYKSNLIESYIRNFLMTKYISLNNAIGANKLISKIKYYHRNYFCFVNKEKDTVRCIIKLNKITNYQIDLKIKSQQELSLNDLKKSDLFRAENVMIENFFDLEKNSDLIYLNNKINLLIKESNNIYEFNCILLEDSIDMGIFEKIKKCMQDKENNHTNEIQNNLRNNPFISNILNYQVYKNKNFEKNGGRSLGRQMGYEIGNSKNSRNEENEQNKLFDMKNHNCYLFDKLLANNAGEKEQFFDKNKLNDYIEQNNIYKSVFNLSDKVFKKSLEELDKINIDINEENKFEEVKEDNYDNNSIENKEDKFYENNDGFNNDKNDNNKIIPESRYIYRKDYNNNYYNYRNQNIYIPNTNRFRRNNRYNTFYNNNYRNYNNNYKKNIANSPFSNDNDTNNTTSNAKEYYSDSADNYNKTDYNNNDNNNKYYNQNNETNDNKFYGRYNKFQYRNSYMNRDNNNYYNRRYNERYNNKFNNNNINHDGSKNFSNNNYNNSYHYYNNNDSFYNNKKNNFSRSRDKSPMYSPNKLPRYNRNDNWNDSYKEKSYDNKYNDRNDRNDRNKMTSNNNYYGDNNNINYFYNINNYYRQGVTGRWRNNNKYYPKGGSYQRNKNEHYNKDYYENKDNDDDDNNINNDNINENNKSNERSMSPEIKSEEHNDEN